MKYIFIINPSSGNGDYQRVVDALNIIKKTQKDIDYDLVLSEYKYHIYEIIKQYQQQRVCLVACGGDGTIHEVLNAMDLENNILAALPLGSGNDFLKMNINHKDTLVSAIKHILSSKESYIDYGEANEIKFINSFGLGFDTRVMVAYDKYRSRFKNRKRAYNYSVFMALKDISSTFVTIDNQSYEIFLMAINNGKFYGSTFMPAPNARIDDGMLDLCIVKKLNYFDILKLMPKYKKGQHLGLKQVVYYQAKSFKIENKKPILMALDGELYKMKDVDVKVVPKGVKFIL